MHSYKNGRVPHRMIRWDDYGNLTDWKEWVDNLIEWYTDEKDPINFGMFYISEPDETLHLNVWMGEKVKQVIRDMDAITGYMFKRFEELNLKDRMNVIFVADHGHTKVRNPEDLIDVNWILGDDWDLVQWNGPSLVAKSIFI